MEITGQTKLTGIIGKPVEHSLSPAIQNAAFDFYKINCIYVPLLVEPDKLSLTIEVIKTFFKGVNVTMPYKQDVISYMDEVDSFSNLVGAVNTIKVDKGRLLGYNTDASGFLLALKQEHNFSPVDKKIAIIGAGGAASSIAIIIALSKAKNLTIINRSVGKAKRLKEIIKSKFKGINVDALSLNDDLPKSINGCDLVINATPVGMKSNESPVEAGLVKDGQLAADLIYHPQETKFLKDAKKAGARIMSGKSMLLYQGAASFEIWTERSAPVEVMKSALELALKNDTD